MRFKQSPANVSKRNHSHFELLKHLDSIKKKLTEGKELTFDLAKDILKADYDVYLALKKDTEVISQLDDMKVDYNGVKVKKPDDFDLDEKKSKVDTSDMRDNIDKIEKHVSDEKDEMDELVNDFGM
eukprot:CAMPEP_0116929660 /NCGR_PEP_ID=MMETSP0467-20121206/26709_1 /TAXON_ID=283647 /ORGANISM="Mesodinium pulex, Strain SPMC105" /LENGTH=125 /DNA_ID=CAMNT_0004609663 /DNA_START=1080 /DNA_END=1457 /DNA_ORIENTATION=+